jgi:hypothetical protein
MLFLTLASLDGYPYSEDMAQRGWVSEGDVCELSFDHCLATHDTASRTFQRIAFEEPIKCGDCSKYMLSSHVRRTDQRFSFPTPALKLSALWSIRAGNED